MNFDKKIEEKLLEFFDQEGYDFHRQGNRDGEEQSVQGELYRKYNSIFHEVYGNGYDNWEEYIYKANLNGYSLQTIHNY